MEELKRFMDLIDGWIPVESGDLPAINKKVYVITRDGNVFDGMLTRHEIFIIEGKIWRSTGKYEFQWVHVEDNTGFWNEIDVLCWKQKPEAPKHLLNREE